MSSPYTPGGPPVWSTQPAWGPPPVQPPDTRETDVAGLSKIWTAALISIIGTALSVAVLIALETGYLRAALPASGSPLAITQTALGLVLGLAIVGLAISVVSFWYYREGFIAFRKVDPRFSSSPTWALLVIIGLILLVLGIAALFAELFSLISCVGPSTTTIPPGCINLGALLGSLGLVLVGAIILIIGYIGTLVAIWRLGDRFGNSLFKVGAVLLIFPYLSFVGQILVLVAASGARTQVRQRPQTGFGTMPSVMAPPPPPPPPS
jgi:hypothetical protein